MYVISNFYFITGIAVIGGALFGFDIAAMSAVIGTDQYREYFFGGSISSTVQGGITSAMPGGAFLGSIASGFLSDAMGRKFSIQIGACIWLIGCTLSCASQNIAMLILGRLVNGLAVGICSAQVPVYVSEVARSDIRGRLVGCQQWAITWGIMIMFYISFGCSYIKSTASFRIPWGVQMLPATSLLIGCMFIPRSPRWLARKGRWQEAEDVLALLHGGGDKEHPYVRQEMSEIRIMVELEKQNADATIWEIFKGPILYRTHIAISTQVWSQLTGVNVMMYYVTYIFKMAGLTGSTVLVSSSIQYVINVVMTIPALYFLDKAGRRRTFLAGSLLMATWLFANAGLMATHGNPAPPGGIDGIPAASWIVHGPASKALIASSYLFVASFACTWGPASWVYPPELFSQRHRSKAVSFAVSCNWLFNFALGYFVPPAFQNIQWKVYIIFGVFCLAMSIHVFLAFPETAGKTLEEVESMFAEHVPAWKTRVGKTKDSELPPESNGTVPPSRSGSKSPELDRVIDEKEV
ncbi:Similar to High-affinity glucose transporter; acc. no. P49374 [Pyronema omphalodes CBS 100304]|uniref:Similar to High-affinity glucose transporter acc. no. P49374 n=1 Tax=Pyronema omphalodes (strain CBS 100304) TaxID=1076935 RepID=U4LFC2_PYROM|nr:Similar to High-affinity glucose transporter; acc. no. P49374 [Pyronema omphalodes CBS 100304]